MATNAHESPQPWLCTIFTVALLTILAACPSVHAQDKEALVQEWLGLLHRLTIAVEGNAPTQELTPMIERQHEIERILMPNAGDRPLLILKGDANNVAGRADFAAACALLQECELGLSQFLPRDHWLIREVNSHRQSIELQQALPAAGKREFGDLVQAVIEAMQQQEQGNVEGCVTILKPLPTKLKRLLGERHMTPRTVLRNLGMVLTGLKRFEEAHAVLKEWAELSVTALGPAHPESVNARITLARTEIELGLLSSAQETLRACEMTILPQDPPCQCESYWLVLGNLRTQQGDHRKAVEHYKTYIALAKTRYPKIPELLTPAINNIARTLIRSGDPTSAVVEIRQLLNDLPEGTPGSMRARLHAQLADAYRDTAQFDRAKQEAEVALELFRREFGEEHPGSAVYLQSLARTAWRANQFQEVLDYSQAIQSLISKDDRAMLDTLSEVSHLRGLAFRIMGNLEEALKQFEMAEELARSVGASPKIVAIHRASAEVELGRPGALERLLQLEAEYHPDPASVEAVNLHSLISRVHWQAGDLDPSLESMDHAQRALRLVRRRLLPGLGHAESLKVVELTPIVSRFDEMVSAASGRGHERINTLTLEWALNDKGVVNSILADTRKFQHQIEESNDSELAHRIQASRAEIARRRSLGQADDDPALRKLTEDVELAAQKLGLLLRSELMEPDWIVAADVRSALPNDTLLIEILLTRPTSSGDSPGNYFAWLMPPKNKGPVRLFRLGDARTINQCVADLRQAISQSGDQAQAIVPMETRAAQLRAVEATAAKLAALLLHAREHKDGKETEVTLYDAAGEFPRWILSPDGDLWLAPWEALPNPQGERILDHHSITHVVSGRSVLWPVAASQSRDAIVIHAPEFGSGNYIPPWLAAADGLPADGWTGLPASSDQAQALGPYASASERLRIVELVGERADEEAINSACRNPSVLFIGSHGFARGGSGGESTQPDPFIQDRIPPLEYCGIVTAGANVQPEGNEPFDNYLTGEEVSRLPLQGTEVLTTACVSAFGKVARGEAVASMSQALQLAGARSVVSTLWEVHQDQGTVALMQAYWKARSQGRTPQQALTDAKREVASRPETANPYFWAAFTYQGTHDGLLPVVLRPGMEATERVDTGNQPSEANAAVRGITQADRLLLWGRNQEALLAYDNEIRERESADALSGRALVQLRLGQVDAAENDYLRALELNPDCARALAVSGLAAIQRQQFDIANRELARAIELDATDPIAVFGQILSVAQRISADLDLDAETKSQLNSECISLIDRAVDLAPDFVDVLALRAIAGTDRAANMQGGQLMLDDGTVPRLVPSVTRLIDMVIRDLDSIEKVNPDYVLAPGLFDNVFELRARLKMARFNKAPEACLADCCEAIRRKPSDPPFVMYLVQTAYLGQWHLRSEFIAVAEQALSALPENTWNDHVIAARRQLLEWNAEAERKLQERLEQAQADGDPVVSALEQRLANGRLNRELGDAAFARMEARRRESRR